MKREEVKCWKAKFCTGMVGAQVSLDLFMGQNARASQNCLGDTQ